MEIKPQTSHNSEKKGSLHLYKFVTSSSDQGGGGSGGRACSRHTAGEGGAKGGSRQCVAPVGHKPPLTAFICFRCTSNCEHCFKNVYKKSSVLIVLFKKS